MREAPLLAWQTEKQPARPRSNDQLACGAHDLAVQFPWLLVLKLNLESAELNSDHPFRAAASHQDVRC
jgi:hypothetical protein